MFGYAWFTGLELILILDPSSVNLKPQLSRSKFATNKYQYSRDFLTLFRNASITPDQQRKIKETLHRETRLESCGSAPTEDKLNLPTSTHDRIILPKIAKRGTIFKQWNIATINVRTLRGDAKAFEIMKAIHDASLDIVGIQEVKRLGQGSALIQVDKTEYNLIWKGQDTKRPGPVLSRFDRFCPIGLRILRGPGQVGFFFCIMRYKIGESTKS